jgi:hypothetical protein
MSVINPGEKFSVIAIFHAGRASGLPAGKDLGDRLLVLSKTPIQIGAPWREWLGSLRCEEFEEANLYIVTTIHSSHLEIADEENQQLTDIVGQYFRSLFLVGGFIYEFACIVSGSNENGIPGVRQFGPIDHYFPSYEAYDFVVGKTTSTQPSV